jgi:hypothetical protein
MADHLATTTQAANPGRATLRTAVQTGIGAFVGLLVILPLVIQSVLDNIGEQFPEGLRIWLAGLALTITALSATLTRVMAIPGVIEWTRTYLPWLAPDSK